MWSTCWRYSCLPDYFQKQDYTLVLDWVTKATWAGMNLDNIHSGYNLLDFFKPSKVAMQIMFK
jgi:hypothetical protein